MVRGCQDMIIGCQDMIGCTEDLVKSHTANVLLDSATVSPDMDNSHWTRHGQGDRIT
jgi:hypothetical protein